MRLVDESRPRRNSIRYELEGDRRCPKRSSSTLPPLPSMPANRPTPPPARAPCPIYQTTSYLFQDADHAGRLFALKEFGNIYTRIMNPTTDVLREARGGAGRRRGGAGDGFGPGGGDADDHHAGRGGRRDCLDDFALWRHLQPLPLHAAAAGHHGAVCRCGRLRRAARGDQRRRREAVYTETLGNPKLDVADIEKLAAIAHENGLPLVIDNTSASPALVRPIEWGADIVVNSATKFLGGHGTTIGGVIVDAGKFDWAASGRFKEFTEPDPSYHGLSYTEAFGPLAFILKARVQGLRDTGAALSPFNAFLLLQGIETLHLRLERHSQNALAVAQHLEQHPGVEWVNYPGLESSRYYARAKKYLPNGQGALVTFGIKGGYEAGKKLIDSLELFSLVANIGDAKSLVIHPASTTHQQLSVEEQAATGVTPELVRLSVGIEDIRDILADLDQAIEAANGHASARVQPRARSMRHNECYDRSRNRVGRQHRPGRLTS